MPTRTLYLLRHGQHESQGEAEDEFGGGLTTIGFEQAELTAPRFESLPLKVIHCSTLRRAVQTAEVISQCFPGIPIDRSDSLRECVPTRLPTFTGKLAQLGKADFARSKAHADRAYEKYFRRARNMDRYEVIVCHANLIRYFVCRALQIAPEKWGDMATCNCGITEIVIGSDGRITLVSFNDAGHLPCHLRTLL